MATGFYSKQTKGILDSSLKDGNGLLLGWNKSLQIQYIRLSWIRWKVSGPDPWNDTVTIPSLYIGLA